MFELSGTINGKSYDKTVVSPDLLNDLFGLKLQKKGFLMVSDLKKRKEAKVYNLSPVIRGNFEGNTVEIRYFRSKTQKEKVTNYVPVRMVHNTGDYSISLEKDFEIAVWFRLSTKTKESPIRGNGGYPYFYIRDKKGEAARELAKIDRVDKIKQEIYAIKNEEDLRILAKGVYIKGFNIPSDPRSSVDEIKLALIKAANASPNEFEMEFNNKLTKVRGMIRRCIELGLIKPTKPYGITQFVFTKDGQIICEVPGSITNQEDYLINFMSNIDVVAGYIEKMKSLMVQVKNAENIVEIPDEVFELNADQTEEEALVSSALKAGVIKYNELTRRVTTKDDETIVKIDGDDWKAEFAEKLKVTITKNKVLKLLKDVGIS